MSDEKYIRNERAGGARDQKKFARLTSPGIGNQHGTTGGGKGQGSRSARASLSAKTNSPYKRGQQSRPPQSQRVTIAVTIRVCHGHTPASKFAEAPFELSDAKTSHTPFLPCPLSHLTYSTWLSASVDLPLAPALARRDRVRVRFHPMVHVGQEQPPFGLGQHPTCESTLVSSLLQKSAAQPTSFRSSPSIHAPQPPNVSLSQSPKPCS